MRIKIIDSKTRRECQWTTKCLSYYVKKENQRTVRKEKFKKKYDVEAGNKEKTSIS